MKTIQTLITKHLDIWTAADTAKKSGRGRSSGNVASVYGIKKLRELILELAVRGKLVPQDDNDEPASELLKRIQVEKDKLIAEVKIKKTKPLLLITDEEKLFNLPHGWEWTRLGNVIDYVNGFAFSSKDFMTQGIGVVKIGDIQQGKIEPEFMSRVSEDAVNGLDARFQVIKGDLVIAMSGATTGKLGFNDTEDVFYLNQRVGKIVPFIVSKRFLYFDLTTKIAENLKKSFGSAIPNLSTEQINTIVTALPPIEEQNRIVAKVDELMTLCDQLENQHSNADEAHEKLVSHLLGTLTQSQSAEDFSTNWQRIAAHFDTLFTTEISIDALKQTLLQLAVMGKLVLQDTNDEPASELLKRIQAEKAKLIAEGKIKKDKPLPLITDEEKPFDLPQSWQWVKPEEFSIKITDGEHFRPPTEENGVYFLSAKDVREEGVSLGDPLFISEETAKKALQRCNPEYGDLLIVSRGATVGRMCKVNIHEKFCLLGSVILVKPTSLVLSDYLSISLKSPSSFSLLINASGSTAQPAIYLKDLKEITLSLPPIEEQHRIVAKVDELITLCDQLKSRITEANQLQQKLADVMVKQTIS